MNNVLKQSILAAIVSSSCFLFAAQSAYSEELPEIFEKVKKYSEEGNYTKAIEELSWAEKELQKKHFEKVQSFLPDTLGSFTGTAGAESQAAFGMSTLEKVYKDGKKKLTLTLTGGAMGGGNNPMGGFAALARMGQMMGQQPGTDTFRIEGRTVNLTAKGNRSELSVFLDSGSVLGAKLNAADAEGLKAIAKQLPIVALDKYLKGESATAK